MTTAEQQGLVDRNLQDYYESMLAMFATKGWKFLTEDLVKLHDAANTLSGIDTMAALEFRRGQLDILAKVIAQPAVIAGAYEVLLDNEAADA